MLFATSKHVLKLKNVIIFLYIYIYTVKVKQDLICAWTTIESTSKRESVPANLRNTHFLHNVRSHNFDNDVTITVIEQIRKDYLTIDRKKELLRNREMLLAKNAELNTTKQTEQKNRLEFHKVFYKVLCTKNVHNIRCNGRGKSLILIVSL